VCNRTKTSLLWLSCCLFLLGAFGCGITRTVVIKLKPAGALIQVDNEKGNKNPFTTKLKWSESAVHTVAAEAGKYERQSLTLRHEDAKSAAEPWVIELELKPLVESVEVEISANIDSANVHIDGVLVGETPLRHTFVFSRHSSKSPWGKHLVVVSKDGYRYNPGGNELLPGENPAFSHQIELDSPFLSEKLIHVVFEPIRFLQTKVRRIAYTEEGVEIEEDVVLSQVVDMEYEPKAHSVSRITDVMPNADIIESRISVMPDGETIIYSFPFKLGSDEFLNIWKQYAGKRARLTDAEKMDHEAAVGVNANWIYFSSNRLNSKKYNLWRMRTDGRGGLTKITDSPSSRIDTEPALSPDGLRLAYTSYLIGASLPQIWVSNADGTLPTQLRIGKTPSWSPEGRKLAFVAPDSSGWDKIWVMGRDGGNPTQLTTGDFHDRYPVWTPDGKRIIYSSNQAINREGERNYDLWIMGVDGSKNMQMTINGSYDTRPSVSQDSKYIYFLSNRGARTEGEYALQIWRME